MAYFNHAFKKTFIIDKWIQPDSADPSVTLAPGAASLYDAKTWQGADVNECCQVVLASGSPYKNDKIGPFHGGYQETIKSKGINPKFITKLWTADAHAAQNSILHIGTTPFTVGKDGCCPTFLCGENYHLRVDVKGSPALRMLNHQAYQEVTAYTGCCPEDAVAPVAADPVLVMIQWSKGISESVILTGSGPNGRSNPAPFVIPVVSVASAASSAAGEIDALLYPEGFVIDPAFEAAAQAAVQSATGQGSAPTISTVDTYTSSFAAGDCAGLTLVGAYEETKFGDCTFQPSDFYGTEPLRLFASEVDLNGDPCEFTGICIEDECKGRKPQGLGETVARDFILSESYRQIPFATDLRIREITQGNDMLGTGPGQANREALYDRLMILHSVPRYNNPSGTFDNDQYLIEILTESTDDGKDTRDSIKSSFEELLEGCNDCVIRELEDSNGECDKASVVVVTPPPAPQP